MGLPTGAGLASLGHQVCCIDCIHEKVEMLRAGKVTLYEEGLEELLHQGIESGSLTFTEDMAEGVDGAQVVMVAVGTPEDPNSGEANLSYLFAAVEQLAECLKTPAVVAIKSTVPVGMCDQVEQRIRATNPDARVEVVSLPEFLREGYAVHDFFHPARIVIGTENESARSLIRELYAPMKPTPKFLCVARRSSEAIKYASNAFLAMKIHYINEMADFCDAIGANIHEVAQGMGLDTRIGSAFLKPGPGYGGSCFPKDTKALLHMAHSQGVELSLVRSTIAGNAKRRELMAHKILEAVKGIPNPRIAVWGLAFKNGTDDCRESPAIGIVQHLVKNPGVTVVAYDPQAMNNARKILGDKNITYAPDKDTAVKGAHVLAILTEWTEFAKADRKQVTPLMIAPRKVIDCRFLT